MKNKLLCIMVMILMGNIVNAQSDENTIPAKADYWNLSISAGMAGNLSSKYFSITDKPSFTYNVDISHASGNYVGIFFNFTKADLPIVKRYAVNSYYSVLNKIDYFQLTMGPRLFSPNGNAYLDGGIGYFNIGSQEKFGATFGIGGRIPISDQYAIKFGGRLNAADLFIHTSLNYSITAGFEFSDKNRDPTTEKKQSRFSIGAYTGSYGGNFSGNTSLGGELTYALSNQTSLLANYIYSNSETGYENEFGAYSTVARLDQNEVTGGVRFFLKGNNLRVFAEVMSGGYFISKDRINSSFSEHYTNAYYGITFGGGVEFKIIDNLSGLLKSDLSNYFDGKSNSGLIGNAFLGLFGGLKYNL